MRTFDFTFLGGLPWTQDTFDFMQKAYQAPDKAFAELGGTSPHIISGMTESAGVVSDGMFYYQGETIPFEGGPVQPTIVITTYNTTLVYGDGTTHIAATRKAATFGTGSVQLNYADLKLFQDAFGQRARLGWKIADFNAPNSECQYFHNVLTGVVYVRGYYRHSQADYTGLSEQKQLATLPASLSYAGTIRFRSQLETHHTPLYYDASGALWTGEVCRQVGAGLSFGSRALMGAPANPTLYYDYSYQL